MLLILLFLFPPNTTPSPPPSHDFVLFVPHTPFSTFSTFVDNKKCQPKYKISVLFVFISQLQHENVLQKVVVHFMGMLIK